MASISVSEVNRALLKTKIRDFASDLLPEWKDVRASLVIFVKILFGGLLLYPIFIRMPFLGWDWYYFFTAHNPAGNINLTISPFLPFTKYLLLPLTAIYWRDSLAILGGITYMAIALGTWKYGGKYGSIFWALTTPIPCFLLWVGHPDGLALVGVLTGFIPFALIKPQITVWSFLRNKAWIFWLALILGITFLFWPWWFTQTAGSTLNHPANFGWRNLGWPSIVLGIVLIAGAGNDPWLLMASGCLLSPDLMPYHLIIFLPALGRVRGSLKPLVWLAAWLVVIGTGVGGFFLWVNLLFPLSVYFTLQKWGHYKSSAMGHYAFVRRGLRIGQKFLSGQYA